MSGHAFTSEQISRQKQKAPELQSEAF